MIYYNTKPKGDVRGIQYVGNNLEEIKAFTNNQVTDITIYYFVMIDKNSDIFILNPIEMFESGYVADYEQLIKVIYLRENEE